jgi:multiple sugar transport system permease protein
MSTLKQDGFLNLAILIGAAVMLVAFALLPWVTIEADDAPAQDATGLSLLFDDHGIATGKLLLFLLPLASLAAITLAAWSMRAPARSSEAYTWAILAGLVCFLHYRALLLSDEDIFAAVGFWVAVGANLAFLLPAAWKKLRGADELGGAGGSDSWQRGLISHLEIKTSRIRAVYALIVVGLIVLSVTVVFPFLYTFTAGLKNSVDIFDAGLRLWPASPIWGNYEEAWNRFGMLKLFDNTIIIIIGGLISQLGISTLAAYSLSRLKPKGGRYILMGFLITLMIPSMAYLIPLYVNIVNLGLINSYFGLWLPYGVNAFMIFLLKSFFDTLPSELFDAAKVDGASALQIFWRIALPLTRPILLVLSILTLVGLWKDFLLPMIVLPDASMQPITVRLWYQTQYFAVNLQMAGFFIGMLPPLLVAIVLQRYMTQGLSIGAVKG